MGASVGPSWRWIRGDPKTSNHLAGAGLPIAIVHRVFVGTFA